MSNQLSNYSCCPSAEDLVHHHGAVLDHRLQLFAVDPPVCPTSLATCSIGPPAYESRRSSRGVAALSFWRLSCRSGPAVEWRHTLVRGDRFGVAAEFAAPT